MDILSLSLKVDTYYPSIQMRPKCNQTHDRDINASINILNV
ncbi:MAG: hypothetical protein UDO63_04635 [Oscillospiraceae bacterium]